MDNYTVNFYAVPPLVTGLAMLVLGVGVLVRERYSRVAVACFVMAIIQSVWLLAYVGVSSSATADVALWWARVAYVAITLIPAGILYFAVVCLGLYDRYRYACVDRRRSVSGCLIDITAASTANEVIHTMTDALIVIDTEDVIRLVNPAARALLNATHLEPTGRPPSRARCSTRRWRRSPRKARSGHDGHGTPARGVRRTRARRTRARSRRASARSLPVSRAATRLR
jgi:PAS domain-containing protein